MTETLTTKDLGNFNILNDLSQSKQTAQMLSDKNNNNKNKSIRINNIHK